MAGMRYRKLRIAWSVGCGILCLLLILLWVRSYWWFDILYYRLGASTMFGVTSEEGAIRFQDCSRIIGAMPRGWLRDRTWHGGYPPSDIATGPLFKQVFRGFERQSRSTRHDTLQVPHWFFVLIASVGGAAPWIHWSRRFSLRTLLITTTLVAALLGAIVWAVK
jgi:hypothetical protein